MAYWLWPRGRTEGRHRGPSPEHELVPAPRINGFTLWSWLIHGHHRDGVWAEVVSEFVDLLKGDPEVIRLFIARDTDIEEFQIHFLSALKILTHTGLTVRLLDQMQERHDGLGITGPMFDRTILTLAGILESESKGVPKQAIQDLLPAVALLRGAIVAVPAERAT